MDGTLPSLCHHFYHRISISHFLFERHHLFLSLSDKWKGLSVTVKDHIMSVSEKEKNHPSLFCSHKSTKDLLPKHLQSLSQADLEHLCMPAKSLQLCLTLCDPMDPVVYQALLSMGFSREEYWSGLPCPPPAGLPDPGIKPASPAVHADSLPLSHWESLEHF